MCRTLALGGGGQTGPVRWGGRRRVRRRSQLAVGSGGYPVCQGHESCAATMRHLPLPRDSWTRKRGARRGDGNWSPARAAPTRPPSLRPRPAGSGPRARASPRTSITRSTPARRRAAAAGGERGTRPRFTCSVERGRSTRHARRRAGSGRSAPGAYQFLEESARGSASDSSPPPTIATTRPRPCCCASVRFGAARPRGDRAAAARSCDRCSTVRSRRARAALRAVRDRLDRDPTNGMLRGRGTGSGALAVGVAEPARRAGGDREPRPRRPRRESTERSPTRSRRAGNSTARRRRCPRCGGFPPRSNRRRSQPFTATQDLPTRRVVAPPPRSRGRRRRQPPRCDCGRGHGWEVRGMLLHLARRAERWTRPRSFHVYSVTARGAGDQGTFTPFPPGSRTGRPSGS